MPSSATMEGIISLEMEGLIRGVCLLRAKTKILCYKKWKSVMNMEYILLKALRRARWGGSLALELL